MSEMTIDAGIVSAMVVEVVEPLVGVLRQLHARLLEHALGLGRGLDVGLVAREHAALLLALARRDRLEAVALEEARERVEAQAVEDGLRLGADLVERVRALADLRALAVHLVPQALRLARALLLADAVALLAEELLAQLLGLLRLLRLGQRLEILDREHELELRLRVLLLEEVAERDLHRLVLEQPPARARARALRARAKTRETPRARPRATHRRRARGRGESARDCDARVSFGASAGGGGSGWRQARARETARRRDARRARLIDSATSDIQSVLENSSIAIVDFLPNERP